MSQHTLRSRLPLLRFLFCPGITSSVLLLKCILQLPRYYFRLCQFVVALLVNQSYAHTVAKSFTAAAVTVLKLNVTVIANMRPIIISSTSPMIPAPVIFSVENDRSGIFTSVIPMYSVPFSYTA